MNKFLIIFAVFVISCKGHTSNWENFTVFHKKNSEVEVVYDELVRRDDVDVIARFFIENDLVDIQLSLSNRLTPNHTLKKVEQLLEEAKLILGERNGLYSFTIISGHPYPHRNDEYYEAFLDAHNMIKSDLSPCHVSNLKLLLKANSYYASLVNLLGKLDPKIDKYSVEFEDCIPMSYDSSKRLTFKKGKGTFVVGISTIHLYSEDQ